MKIGGYKPATIPPSHILDAPFWQDAPDIRRKFSNGIQGIWAPANLTTHPLYGAAILYSKKGIMLKGLEGCYYSIAQAAQTPLGHATVDGAGNIFVQTSAGLEKFAWATKTWSTVIAIATYSGFGYLRRGIVDLGAGKMLLFGYESTSVPYFNKILYSSDYGATWSLHIDPTSTKFHWHGAVKVGTRLLAFRGDSYTSAAICVCDDIADFIANPATWATRWGLDSLAAHDEAPEPLEGYGIVGWVTGQRSDQSLRVLDVVANEAGDWGYCGSDGSIAGDPTSAVWSKIPLTPGQFQAKRVGTGHHAGAAFYGLRVPESDCGVEGGLILIGTSSQALGPGPNIFFPYSDKYSRIYALEPDGSRFREILRLERADHDDASFSGIATLNFYNWYGAIVGYCDIAIDREWDHSTLHPRNNYLFVGRVIADNRNSNGQMLRYPHDRMANFRFLEGINLLANGQMASVAKCDATPYSDGWKKASATSAQETTLAPPYGQGYCLKITPTPGATDARVLQWLPMTMTRELAGQYVTLEGYIWLPNSAIPQSQKPGIQFTFSRAADGYALSVTVDEWFNTAPDWDGAWHRFKKTLLIILPTGDNIQATLYAHLGVVHATDHVPIYFANVRMSIGVVGLPADCISRDTIDETTYNL